MKGTIRWSDEMNFSGEIGGTTIEIGEETIAPMQMMLLSVAGCTAFDVVHTLKKFREPIEGLEVKISGERRDTHPRHFTRITLEYFLEGGLSEKKVERAIRLSQEKYCSAMAQMRKSGVEVSWSYKIV